MSASRFFSGSSLFRSTTHRPFSPIPSFVFPKKTSLRFHCSSAAVDTITEPLCASPHHPWPEWVTFVDRLKAKGYFVKPPAEKDGENIPSVVYNEINVVKDACLSFARDRYDVFKHLSAKDMQTVVEKGCPNLFRKSVNSAKRLRAHLRLDEGDVCGACDLRGSCDRAYVILKDSESAARTVDIVRILLLYALDPLVVSGGEKSSNGEILDGSARKLLSELVELSETPPDPTLPRPAIKSATQKKQVMENNNECEGFVMKSGDWRCSKCTFINFARNTQCLKCNEYAPEASNEIEMKKGDWSCPECSFMNFARNIKCLKCKTQGPKKVVAGDAELKKGDWNCTECGFMNFSSNRKCLRCRESRPKRDLNPGEWECPSCDFVNFRRNTACKKCDCQRPREFATERF